MCPQCGEVAKCSTKTYARETPSYILNTNSQYIAAAAHRKICNAKNEQRREISHF